MVRLSREEAYLVLGLDGDRDMAEEEIKKAYRKKSLETHPDKNPVRTGTRACSLASGAGMYLIARISLFVTGVSAWAAGHSGVESNS